MKELFNLLFGNNPNEDKLYFDLIILHQINYRKWEIELKKLSTEQMIKYREILRNYALVVDAKNYATESNQDITPTLETLQIRLETALQNEDYLKAAILRDKIKQYKKV